MGSLKFIPAPNSGPSSFSAAPQNQILHDNKFATRIDYNRTANDQYSGYYFYDDATVVLPYTNPTFENVPGFGGATLSRSQLATISNTRIFGNNKVNEARGVFLRSAANRNLPQGGLGNVGSFGFVEGGLGLIPTWPPVEGLPDIELENTGVNIGAAPENGPLNGNTYQGLDNFTLTKGRHNVKFGGEFRIVQSNERQAYASNGQFQFLGGETGIDAADYLIGTPDYFYMASYQLSDARTKVYGLYGQDSIKMSSNLKPESWPALGCSGAHSMTRETNSKPSSPASNRLYSLRLRRDGSSLATREFPPRSRIPRTPIFPLASVLPTPLRQAMDCWAKSLAERE